MRSVFRVLNFFIVSWHKPRFLLSILDIVVWYVYIDFFLSFVEMGFITVIV